MTSTSMAKPRGTRGLLSWQPGLVPRPVSGNQLLRLPRPPRALRVLVHWRRRVQQRLEDPPRLLDAVLAGEPGAVADHRRLQQDLVRGRPLPALLAEFHVEVDALRLDVAGSLGVEPQPDARAGIDLHHDLVGLRADGALWEEPQPRGMVKDEAQLG